VKSTADVHADARDGHVTHDPPPWSDLKMLRREHIAEDAAEHHDVTAADGPLDAPVDTDDDRTTGFDISRDGTVDPNAFRTPEIAANLGALANHVVDVEGR
jgi:hypothetical protein